VWITPPTGEATKQTRTFTTMTADLLALGDWLKSHKVTHVAMESTGVYWRPIYNLLEGHFELLVVDAQHINAVPGRKPDVADAEWIGDLLRHGLVRGSFIPPQAQRELRELTRHRSNVVVQRAQAANELQRTLEGANIKLASVPSDITGVSATAMLRALLDGQSDAAALAELAKGRLRRKKEALRQALTGRLRAHHKLIIAQLLYSPASTSSKNRSRKWAARSNAGSRTTSKPSTGSTTSQGSTNASARSSSPNWAAT
jgi:transposase